MGVGSSVFLNRPPAETQPICFIDFNDFKEVGQYPRYRDHKIAKEVSTLDLTDAFVVYVSHMWMRSGPKMQNFKEYPRPDTEDNEQYKLCVAGIDSLIQSNQARLKKCFVWIDTGCLQHRDPALVNDLKASKKINRLDEIDRQVGQIMSLCDCMLTPDTGLADFISENDGTSPSARAPPSREGYLSRGWCIAEMQFAADIPLTRASHNKAPHMSRVIQFAYERKRRPHFVFGARERAHDKPPLIAPPSLIRQDLSKGVFTHKTDARVVFSLVEELCYHYKKKPQLGYHGNYDDNGLRQGHGRYVFPSGGVYEGGYLNDLKHGFGRFDLASGDVYEGGYKNDRREGHGTFKFTNGDFYEGNWLDGKPNGQGKVEYASGDVYEGHFKDHMKHGFGLFTFSTGCRYEGWYKDDLRHGRGKYVWSDGDWYDGEWKDHMKHGYGVFRFASGATYQGMWRADNRHGEGKYRLLNGELYEGEYKHDMREGHGTYLFRSGAKYDGFWRKHRKNGMGKLYSPHGNVLVYDGEWIEDKPQGYVDPMLIFEDDIQYMEVMAVIQHAEAVMPSLRHEPTVRELEALPPSATKVTGHMTDEYFNEDGILDEDDDFHPKNLFRRKSEDWIDRAPKWNKEVAVEKPVGSAKPGDEEKTEYTEEFHVEKENAKRAFSAIARTGAADVDKHDRVKKMFSPVRRVIHVSKIMAVSPMRTEDSAPDTGAGAGAGVVNDQGKVIFNDDVDPTEMDDASMEESSARNIS